MPMSQSLHQFESTIVARATPMGEGAVAVVRLSGLDSWAIANKLFTPANKQPLKPWHIAYGEITVTDNDGQRSRLDEALVLPFKTPKSFTGEDVIEFHLHGGEFLTGAVIEACMALGAHPAQAGEFSRRAFLNGRIDLSQAESILDLLNAQGSAMLNAATGNLREEQLAQQINAMSEQLIAIQADIVASVDFPDEVDEPDRKKLISLANSLLEQLSQWITVGQHHQWVRHGLKLALLGRPNAGKSSLFNQLVAAERAIVTPIAGTTRDTVDDHFTLGGVPITLTDTAGLREKTDDTVEAIGMDRSWQAAKQANGILYLVNLCDGLTHDDRQTLRALASQHEHLIVVGTHQDVSAQTVDVEKEIKRFSDEIDKPLQYLSISNLTGTGLSNLINLLENWVSQCRYSKVMDVKAQQQICLNQRQRVCLQNGLTAIELLLSGLKDECLPLDMLTIPITDGLRALDSVLGRDTTEDVLTSVFQQFCVGK